MPIYDAGSTESRMATLSLVNITSPTAWIDTYYPVLNTPLERELQILQEDGSVAWNADVEEQEFGGDPAGKYAKTIGAWHGLSAAGDVKVRCMEPWLMLPLTTSTRDRWSTSILDRTRITTNLQRKA